MAVSLVTVDGHFEPAVFVLRSEEKSSQNNSVNNAVKSTLDIVYRWPL